MYQAQPYSTWHSQDTPGAGPILQGSSEEARILSAKLERLQERYNQLQEDTTQKIADLYQQREDLYDKKDREIDDLRRKLTDFQERHLEDQVYITKLQFQPETPPSASTLAIRPDEMPSPALLPSLHPKRIKPEVQDSAVGLLLIRTRGMERRTRNGGLLNETRKYERLGIIWVSTNLIDSPLDHEYMTDTYDWNNQCGVVACVFNYTTLILLRKQLGLQSGEDPEDILGKTTYGPGRGRPYVPIRDTTFCNRGRSCECIHLKPDIAKAVLKQTSSGPVWVAAP